MKEKEIKAQIKTPELLEKRHEQIVRGASELFSKRGYHATTLREISSACSINLSYLYKYISSKDDILYLFYRHLNKEWAHIYEELARPTDEDPVEQLRAFINSVFEVLHKRQDEVLTMYTESRYLSSESLRTVLSEESRMIKCVEKLIIRGVEKGCFRARDTFFVANFIQFTVVIYTLRGWNLKKKYTFTRVVELTTDIILSALGVGEESI